MIIKRESSRRAVGLTDLLDYFALVDDGILLLDSGTFLAGWELRGPDLSAYTFQDASALCSRIERRLHLGAGWTIQVDQFRASAQEYSPVGNWPDAVSELIDEERRQHFRRTDGQAHYASRYFLCLTYQPPKPSKVQDWIFDAPIKEKEMATRDLKRFLDCVQEMDCALHANLDREKHTLVRRLKTIDGTFCDLCRYVRYAVTGEDFAFRLPDDPVFLNHLLAGDNFMPGRGPRFGDRAIRVIAVDSFPGASFAGILRELDSLPFALRFSQQAQCMDEAEAAKLHLTSSKRWKFSQVSLLRSFVNKGTPPVSEQDHFAVEMEAEAAAAKSEAEHGRQYFVRYSAKVILLDKSAVSLSEQTEKVRTVLKHAGFGSRVETINATAAWHGSLPGHAWRDRRVSVASTTNLVHLMPLSAPFRGLEQNPSRFMPPGSAPLFYAATQGRTPFRFHLHVGDVGHTANIGPSGAGKTTLQLLTCAQFLRYPNARVYCLDKEWTAYTLTKALGGDYYDLSGDGTLRFCPLRDLDTPSDLAWANRYIEMLCAQSGLQLTPEMRNSVSRAVLYLSVGDPSMRSLSDLHMLVDDQDVKRAIEYYTVASSASGGILDGRTDALTDSHFSAFELGALYKSDQKIASAVLFYLFRKIWKNADPSRPTLVAVDEFKHAMEHPLAVKNFDDFLTEGRKLNIALMIAIQEPGKLVGAPLRDAISRECRTKIFLPNAQARAEKEAYEVFGLNDLDLAYITDAQPCQDYYATSPEGKRMIDLELGEVALSFIAKSGRQDREILDRMIAGNPASWRAAWLRYWGVSAWADYLEAKATKEERGMAIYA